MSTTTTLEINTFSPKETERLGEALGSLLKGGEVIDITSDLGGGKTTFIRGLARGLGSINHVSSPTFKICNLYNAKENIKIYHYDFYRLGDPGLMAFELEEAINDNNAVIVIEWSNIVSGLLPEDKISVKIVSLEDNIRKIKIEFLSSNKHLTNLNTFTDV